MREQRQRLEHHAEIAPVRGHMRLILARHQNPAGIGRLQPRDQPQQRGLAAARRAEQADEPPVRNVKRDILDRRHIGEAAGEPAERQPGHARPAARPGFSR